MGKTYMVIEVVGNEGVANVYVSDTQTEAEINNNFRRLAEDGIKPTGTYSFIEVDDEGNLYRIPGLVERAKAHILGFRPKVAWLK